MECVKNKSTDKQCIILSNWLTVFISHCLESTCIKVINAPSLNYEGMGRTLFVDIRSYNYNVQFPNPNKEFVNWNQTGLDSTVL